MPTIWKFWEPQLSGALRACPDLCRDSKDHISALPLLYVFRKMLIRDIPQAYNFNFPTVTMRPKGRTDQTLVFSASLHYVTKHALQYSEGKKDTSLWQLIISAVNGWVINVMGIK